MSISGAIASSSTGRGSRGSFGLPPAPRRHSHPAKHDKDKDNKAGNSNGTSDKGGKEGDKKNGGKSKSSCIILVAVAVFAMQAFLGTSATWTETWASTG